VNLDRDGRWVRVCTDRVEFRVWHRESRSPGQKDVPLVFLHGFPETAIAWRKVVPILAKTQSIVVPDLPGYDESTILDPDSYTYDKRGVGRDIVALLRALGYQTMHLVGHDRGARVAYRIALDHPDVVTRLVLLAVVPTLDVFNAVDYRLANGMYHWSFLAQPYPLPETLLHDRAKFYVPHTIRKWGGTDTVVEQDALDQYVAAFSNPAVVRAGCEDYRAGFHADYEHDSEDRRAGRKIACPVLVVWGKHTLGYIDDVTATWRRWATDVRGEELECKHFVMEECPNEVADLVERFCPRPT
jgi:haloacetate dehalogenase